MMKKVGIIMGSDSDLPILRKSMDTLTELGIPYECHIFSAHRTPEEALNRLFNLPWHLSKEQKAWLKSRMQDRRPEVKVLAQEQYDMRFGRMHQEIPLDDFDHPDENEFEEIE